MEEFNDFAVEAFAESEADGEFFGLGGNREISDGLRLDSAGGAGFGWGAGLDCGAGFGASWIGVLAVAFWGRKKNVGWDCVADWG